jgi:hypothetical protein
MSNKLHFAFSPDRVGTKPDKAKPNARITFDELRAIITGPAPAEYAELPALARRVYVDAETATADLLKAKKSKLPYFLASGFCPIHHSNETLQYNGVLQIDIDFKVPTGEDLAADLLEKIKRLKPAGVIMATVSPSVFGVKILLLTDNLDKERHGEALTVGIDYLRELLQVDPSGKFDVLGASQPVYVPYDRTPGQAFFNAAAEALHVEFKQRRAQPTAADRSEYPPGIVSAAAQFLIENRADVATGRDEYLRVCAACSQAFGDIEGKRIAWQILENSAAFGVSNFRKKFDRTFDSLKRTGGTVTTGGTLVWLAKEYARCNGLTFDTTDEQAPEHHITANEGEYLLDCLRRHGYGPEHVVGKYVIAPTGAGKTTLIGQYLAAAADRRAVLVVPTRALVKRICTREKTAVGFFGGQRNVTGTETFIVVTLKSFVALSTRVDLSKYDVFFDEAHAFTTDTSRAYKLDDLRAFYSLARKLAKSITYLTGTPVYNFHPDFKTLERLRITRPQSVEKTVEYVYTPNVLATVAEGVRRSIARGRFPVVLLNDKYLKLAEIEAALNDVRLAILNSDKKEDAIFQQITERARIPEGVQGIVTTVVLKEGNDIYDDRAFDFLIVGAHHSSTVEQITARARDAQEVRAVIIKSDKLEKSPRWFIPSKYAALAESRAQTFCDEYNNQSQHDDTTAIFWERETQLAIQYRPVVEDENGKMQVCPFALNNEVFTAETQVEYVNDEYQIGKLQAFGFVAGKSVTIPQDNAPEYDTETRAAVKQARSVCKERKAAAHQTALDTLQAAINPLGLVQRAELDNSAPKGYKWFKRLVEKFGAETRCAIDLLRDVDTPKKYGELENRLRVQLLHNNREYLDSGRIFALILQKMFLDIDTDKPFTADELRDRLRGVLSLDRSFDMSFLDPSGGEKRRQQANRRAVRLLRMFFNVTDGGRESSRMCHRNRLFILRKHSAVSVTRTRQKPIPIEKRVLESLTETCPF